MRKILFITAMAGFSACLPLKKYLKDDRTCTFQTPMTAAMETFDIQKMEKLLQERNKKEGGIDVISNEDFEERWVKNPITKNYHIVQTNKHRHLVHLRACGRKAQREILFL